MKRFFNLFRWWKKKKENQEPVETQVTEYGAIQEILLKEGDYQNQNTATREKEAVLPETEYPTTETIPAGIQNIDAFREYIIERFQDPFFEPVELGITPGGRPCLAFQFKSTSHDLKFAVECKWREDFIKGRVEWAKGHQMAAFRQYQQENDTTVFVLIGIGGEPADPREVYIIPLKEIRSNVLAEYQLNKYRRPTKGSFYFDPNHLVLC